MKCLSSVIQFLEFPFRWHLGCLCDPKARELFTRCPRRFYRLWHPSTSTVGEHVPKNAHDKQHEATLSSHFTSTNHKSRALRCCVTNRCEIWFPCRNRAPSPCPRRPSPFILPLGAPPLPVRSLTNFQASREEAPRDTPWPGQTGGRPSHSTKPEKLRKPRLVRYHGASRNFSL